jgi:hypothetical protein
VVFVIEMESGVRIKSFSALGSIIEYYLQPFGSTEQDEDEYMLPPGMTFLIDAVDTFTNGVTQVKLHEVAVWAEAGIDMIDGEASAGGAALISEASIDSVTAPSTVAAEETVTTSGYVVKGSAGTSAGLYAVNPSTTSTSAELYAVNPGTNETFTTGARNAAYQMPGLGDGDLYDQATVNQDRSNHAEHRTLDGHVNGTTSAVLNTSNPDSNETITTSGFALNGSAGTISGAGLYSANLDTNETITETVFGTEDKGNAHMEEVFKSAANLPLATNKTITTSGYVVKGSAGTNSGAGLYAANS